MTEPQVEREAVEEESREKESQVESNWPTQLTPEVEPPTLLEERPNRTEPEQKEPAKMAEAAFPSSTVDLQPASVKIKKEAPTNLLDDVDDVKRTESTNNAESKQTVEESKPAAADPQEALLSSVVSAKEAINGEPKEPSPPKQVQQEEGPDACPASKLMKQDKHGEH